jgi:hypothetical protein
MDLAPRNAASHARSVNGGRQDDRKLYTRSHIFLTTDPDLFIECLRVDDELPPKYEPIMEREREYNAMRARMQY